MLKATPLLGKAKKRGSVAKPRYGRELMIYLDEIAARLGGVQEIVEDAVQSRGLIDRETALRLFRLGWLRSWGRHPRCEGLARAFRCRAPNAVQVLL